MRPFRTALSVFGVLGSFAACDSPPHSPPPSSETPIGHVQLAVGEELREIPFARVECSEEAGARRIVLSYDREVPNGQGALYRPKVFVARTRGDEVLEAHVFAPYISFAGEDYKLLQIVAKEVHGASTPNCRVERESETSIVCNGATVVPWHARGPRPSPSFRVTFDCGS